MNGNMPTKILESLQNQIDYNESSIYLASLLNLKFEAFLSRILEYIKNDNM